MNPTSSDTRRERRARSRRSSLTARASPILPPVPSSPQALTAKLLGCVSPADVSAAAASVVFFDDSRENVAGAIRRGFVRSVLIDERCFTRGAWEDAKERVGMERFIA